MIAKEMFEELGYKERPGDENYSMLAVKVYTKGIKHIYFDFDKTIDTYSTIIDMKLLKAINKQVEELGWNNE